MSRLIGVVLMVFALMFGMTLAGCGDKEPEKAPVEEVEKEIEGAVEEGEKKVEEAKKEIEKKVEETAPKK